MNALYEIEVPKHEFWYTIATSITEAILKAQLHFAKEKRDLSIISVRRVEYGYNII